MLFYNGKFKGDGVGWGCVIMKIFLLLNFFLYKCQIVYMIHHNLKSGNTNPLLKTNKQILRCIIYNWTLEGNQFPLERTQYTGYIPGCRQVEGVCVFFWYMVRQASDMTLLNWHWVLHTLACQQFRTHDIFFFPT